MLMVVMTKTTATIGTHDGEHRARAEPDQLLRVDVGLGQARDERGPQLGEHLLVRAHLVAGAGAAA